MSRDLLFEIGAEEIPAGFVSFALKELAKLADEELSGARLAHGGISVYGTPRRLALYVRRLSEAQEDLLETSKGPLWSHAFDQNGCATKSAVGFARGKGVTVEELEMREVDGAEYTFAVRREAGAPAMDILPGLLTRLIRRLVFPKNMYWEDPAIRFARPIRWILALFGGDVVPVSLGSLVSGRTTRGHRFMGARHLEIDSPKEYLGRLYDEFVLADLEKRREKLLSAVASIEKELGGKVELDPDLVEENVNLVEYPIAFWGSFDPAFLDVPEEALTTSMKKNQRYFPVRDAQGKLLPCFVGISNNRATLVETVREGNERVLRARLSDAAFFFREDQKIPLSGRVESLKAILYQVQLGSVHDKAARARELAVRLAVRLGREDLVPLVDRAAFLAKADLTTSMVYEFPELQGIMGREYARRSGEDKRVALAVEEQYLPRSASDRLPTDAVGAILGIADRIDTIGAICKIGQDPTGSADPYGLRRAARTIDEILFGLEMDVDVAWLLVEAGCLLDSPAPAVEKSLEFFRQRLLFQLKERGCAHGPVSLAIQVAGGRPLQALRLAKILEEQRETPWFGELVTAAVRVRNILSKAGDPRGEPDTGAFVADAERSLFEALSGLEPRVEEAIRESRWRELMEALHALSPVIARFFEDVMVMDQDLAVRENRLALLRRVRLLFDRVGDLGLLR